MESLLFFPHKKPCNFAHRKTVSACFHISYAIFHGPTNGRTTLLDFNSAECEQPIESGPDHEIVTSATKTIEPNFHLNRCVDHYFARGLQADDWLDSIVHDHEGEGSVMHRIATTKLAKPLRQPLQKRNPVLTSVNKQLSRCFEKTEF
jgi:hypothetical protein